MKIDINPQKELFKWGPLGAKLIYISSSFIDTILLRVPKHYPWPWPPSLCLFKAGRMAWINEYPAVGLVGLKYFKKYFLNLKNYQSLWQKWEDWQSKWKDQLRELEQIDFKNINSKELYRCVESFCDLNACLWLIGHVPEVVNIGANFFFRNKLKRIFKAKTDEYLEILLRPTKFSFLQKEELDLLGLSLSENKKELLEALREHTKKYHWILNSYAGNRVLKRGYFEKRLKSLLKEKSAPVKIQEIKNTIKKNKQRKARLIKKLDLNQELILMTEQLSQSIWWQDLRKVYIWQLNYFWDKFLKEIGRRSFWKFSELQWCWPRELLALLKGKKVNRKEILKRRNYYAIFGKEGKLKEFTQQQFIKKLFDVYLETKVAATRVLKGLVVSRGKEARLRGRAKIIKNPFSEAKKMKKGDILIATMTEPEFIVLMRKAKAVITDHGGMTSHAAVVSRELGIPCITGTKVATKVLKSGDTVEVNVNHGVVKVLKRKKG